MGWRNSVYGFYSNFRYKKKNNIHGLEYSLIYKHTYGGFPQGYPLPSSQEERQYDGLEYDKITHKCGGIYETTEITGEYLNSTNRLVSKVPAVPDRKYPDGTVTLPFYSFNDKVLADLLVDGFGFRSKVKEIFCNSTTGDKISLVFSALKDKNIGDETVVSLSPFDYKGSYNAGAKNGIGLGTADLELQRVDLTVKKTNEGFNILGVTVWGEVKDIFDYNYFTGTDTSLEQDIQSGNENKLAVKKFRATAAGASIECGFHQSNTKEGNISSVAVSLNENHFTFKDPVEIKMPGAICLNPVQK